MKQLVKLMNFDVRQQGKARDEKKWNEEDDETNAWKG